MHYYSENDHKKISSYYKLNYKKKNFKIEQNLILSEKRAKAIADYLVSNGINKTLVSYKGLGEGK